MVLLVTFSVIVNHEGHQNRCIGSTVKAFLLNGWFSPLGELHRQGSALQPAQQVCLSYIVRHNCMNAADSVVVLF